MMTERKTALDANPLDQALRLHQSGQLDQARLIYREVLRSEPLHFDAHYLWGLLEGQQGQLALSTTILSRALSLQPDHALAHWHMGEAFIQMEYYEAAITCFRRARIENPAFVDACVREGNLLRDTGHPAEALDAYLQAESVDPSHADVQFSIGNIFKGAFLIEAAISHYRKSIIARPEHPDPYVNLGNSLKELNELDAALTMLHRASVLEPQSLKPLFNQSLITLLQGDFERGWPLFETRWEVLMGGEKRHFRKPRWSGREALSGRTIFIYAEQGLGDSLQFCRYLPLLSAKGAQVIFEGPETLRAVLKELKGAINWVVPGHPIPDFDYHAPLMSLPGAFGTVMGTIPAEVPYLRSSAEKDRYWASRLGKRSIPRIGLAWSGGTVFRNDQNRSLSLDLLLPLFELPFEFHVIQKEVRESDEAILARQANLFFHGEQLFDFSDTASLISEMDLVISVDTSVAHLAGALNCPLWVLLPFAPDFRWLLGRVDSPWYPSARLFRQSQRMDWASVISDVKLALLQQDW